MSAPWKVLRRLGAGGTAELFAVRSEARGLVAIEKRLFAHFAREPVGAALFAHEVRVHRAMRGVAGVPAFIEAGESEGRPCMRIELIPARTLGAMMGGAAMESGSIVRVLDGALGVLEGVHSARDPETGAALRVVHGDVSPTNVLVRDDGRVALIDFGVARSAWWPDEDRTTRGTPGYVAPEVYEGALAPDHRADLYSVGVIAWELFENARLFPGGSLAAMSKTMDEARAVSAPKRASERVGAWVLRAMERDREKRFASATEMRAALREATQGEGG